MRQTVLILILGLLLDLIFGDPYWLYHPVRLIGLLISKLEAVFRKLFPRTEKGELAAGVCLGLSVTVISAGVPLLVLLLATSSSVNSNVSRPTIIETACRAFSKSPSCKAAYTFMLSLFRDFTARSW